MTRTGRHGETVLGLVTLGQGAPHTLFHRGPGVRWTCKVTFQAPRPTTGLTGPLSANPHDASIEPEKPNHAQNHHDEDGKAASPQLTLEEGTDQPGHANSLFRLLPVEHGPQETIRIADNPFLIGPSELPGNLMLK